MKKFNAWLFEKIFSKKEVDRKYVGYLEGWISIAGNFILFLFKYFSGVYLRSIALIADAFHSLSDVLTSVIVILGFRLGNKPADKEHPFGHGRIEEISTLVIAMLLIIVAIDLAKGSFERILHPQKVSFNLIVFLLLIVSAIFKEWMASFSIFLGEKIDSSTLIADAWHHRSDAIAGFLVALGLVFAIFGWYILDGILGFIVSLLIFLVGFDLIKSSTNFLIGEAPKLDFIKKIESIVSSIPGVLSYHDISVHDYKNQKVITIHIEVENNLTAKEAHEIALGVQDSIKKNIENSDVVVHIDPKGERED